MCPWGHSHPLAAPLLVGDGDGERRILILLSLVVLASHVRQAWAYSSHNKNAAPGNEPHFHPGLRGGEGAPTPRTPAWDAAAVPRPLCLSPGVRASGFGAPSARASTAAAADPGIPAIYGAAGGSRGRAGS